MAKFKTLIVCILFFASLSAIFADTYTLTDGQTLSGDPISFDKNGVVLKSSGGAFLPRTPYQKFTQDSIKALAAQVKKPADRALLEPFLEEVEIQKQQRKVITVTPPPKIELPQKTSLFAMFASPLGLVLILILYGANIYAAYEVAFLRFRPAGLVCGVAAVLPVLGPVIFFAMPPPKTATELEQDAQAQAQAHAQAAEPEPVAVTEQQMAEEHAASVAAAEAEIAAAAASAVPETVTYQRGQTIFNRRFFETKLPGFLKAVPSEADQDLIVYIKAVRGEFVGRRISKLSPADISLLTFKGGATAEELIPFNEIFEVQVRHKDNV